MASKASCAKSTVGFNSNDVAPYIHQWAVMTACALFVMNVQVTTRYVTNLRVTDAFSNVTNGVELLYVTTYVAQLSNKH